ncbi:MAG: NUDIX hydrolase [Lachnospiraceae bacterium]|nr:NUDIX hydrolase [Lachnospiraceae bacterium]
MSEKKLEKFQILGKKLEHQGRILDFYSYEMLVPNGNHTRWDVIEHKGAAAVVPVDQEGKIILVRQYRGAIDDFLLEIPAGGRDSTEEDFAVCAARELEEEIGYRCENLCHLVDYHSAAAYTSEKIGIYYAENLIPATQHLDENEFVQIERYTLPELVELIARGEITDGKTIAAIMAYKVLRGK